MTPQKLKQWRDKLGMTQQEFAELVGYKVWTISKWEQGKGDIPLWMDLIHGLLTKKQIMKCSQPKPGFSKKKLKG